MLIILLVVVSCAPKMSDEELEAELSKLSPEELEAVTAEDSGTLAGMAKANPKLIQLQSSYKNAISTSRKCSDKDADATYPNGRDYFEKGAITWSVNSQPNGPVEDACNGDTSLRENYCSKIPDGLRLTEIVDCQKVGEKNFPGTTGWKCVDGACVAPGQMQPVNATKPEQMQPVNATEPEQMQPVNATEPEQMQPVNATEPEQMQPVNATEPEQMQPVNATKPEQMQPVGVQCEVNADCQSNNCDNGVCA
ncbi:MAG: hypothetical protein Q7S55_00390 [Nanoarchaeota archaeon]|nr:hypothetical protein [Nanoarchaeota archaeon]